MILRVTIDGPPIGKERPRVTRRGTYTPPRTAAQEEHIAMVVRLATSARDLAIPLRLHVLAIGARPSRRPPRWPRDHWVTGSRRPRVSTPEGDNVIKLAADALTAAAIIRDDAYIIEWYCLDLYAAAGEGPSTEIALAAWTGDVSPLLDSGL